MEQEKCKESIKKKAQAALFKGINRELRDYKKSSEELSRELETVKSELQQMTKEKEMHERTATDMRNRIQMMIEKSVEWQNARIQYHIHMDEEIRVVNSNSLSLFFFF